MWTIRPSYYLPAIRANGTVLDGATQTIVRNSNAQGPEVEIDFSLLDQGDSYLQVAGSNCTIRGLVLNRFSSFSPYGAIEVTGSMTRVSGCYIGTDASGQSAFASDTTDYGGIGIQIRGGSNSNVIGGTLAAERNVISGGATNNTRFRGIAFVARQPLLAREAAARMRGWKNLIKVRLCFGGLLYWLADSSPRNSAARKYLQFFKARP